MSTAEEALEIVVDRGPSFGLRPFRRVLCEDGPGWRHLVKNVEAVKDESAGRGTILVLPVDQFRASLPETCDGLRTRGNGLIVRTCGRPRATAGIHEWCWYPDAEAQYLAELVKVLSPRRLGYPNWNLADGRREAAGWWREQGALEFYVKQEITTVPFLVQRVDLLVTERHAQVLRQREATQPQHVTPKVTHVVPRLVI